MPTQGEIKEIREEVRSVSSTVSELNGYLRGFLPTLATKADVHKAISKHKDSCHEVETVPRKRRNYWAITGLPAGGAALYMMLEFLVSKFGGQ